MPHAQARACQLLLTSTLPIPPMMPAMDRRVAGLAFASGGVDKDAAWLLHKKDCRCCGFCQKDAGGVFADYKPRKDFAG